ncbi:MAG TPA: porin family protein [Hanamia sp.]|nr:porin family protein [Hanamia sp.]
MKKLFAAALCVALFTNAKSQKVYIQGGVNLANISTSNSGSTEKNNMLTSFNAGIMGRSNASEAIALETGLLLDGRGSKSESGSGNTFYKVTFNPLYLELPVNLIVRLPLANSKSNIFVNAGPYVAMGIAGKTKLDGQLAGATIHSDKNIQFTSTDPTENDQAYSKLKRFDYGVNVGAGFDLGRILLKANYGLGLAKINSTQTNNNANDKDKYRTVSISVGIPLTHK